jgi:hypothetical protein
MQAAWQALLVTLASLSSAPDTRKGLKRAVRAAGARRGKVV